MRAAAHQPYQSSPFKQATLSNRYKRTHQLGRDIAKRSLRLSEIPEVLASIARHFSRRNRIVSDLGQVVIVVEAAAKSGCSVTARNTADQGRDALAVHRSPSRLSRLNRLRHNHGPRVSKVSR
jgi:predicted Rossmann fold nucleotide-binding protein DprA/Smf involved in DNA uptake